MATAQATKNRHARMECVGCGMIARASRTSMRRYGLPTHCGRPMMPDDPALAVELLPEDMIRLHDGVQEEYARMESQARTAWARGRLGGERKQHRCSACPRFIRGPYDVCSCGYCNRTRKYVETVYTSSSDGIPF